VLASLRLGCRRIARRRSTRSFASVTPAYVLLANWRKGVIFGPLFRDFVRVSYQASERHKDFYLKTLRSGPHWLRGSLIVESAVKKRPPSLTRRFVSQGKKMGAKPPVWHGKPNSRNPGCCGLAVIGCWDLAALGRRDGAGPRKEYKPGDHPSRPVSPEISGVI